MTVSPSERRSDRRGGGHNFAGDLGDVGDPTQFLLARQFGIDCSHVRQKPGGQTVAMLPTLPRSPIQSLIARIEMMVRPSNLVPKHWNLR